MTKNTDTKDMFSATEVNRNLIRLREFVETTEINIIGTELFRQIYLEAIDVMINAAKYIDENCSFNKGYIGRQLVNALASFPYREEGKKVDALQDIYTMIYRFIREVEFSLTGEAGSGIKRIVEYTEMEMLNFPEKHRSQLHYASFLMPVYLLKSLAHHPDVQEYKKVDEKLVEISKLKANWDKEISIKLTRVHLLAENLKKLTSEYNFAGLVNGFIELRDSKNTEKRISVGLLFLLAALMLGIPIVQILYIFSQAITSKSNPDIDTLNIIKDLLIIIAPATIAIEFIIFYFFRVVLSNFRSIKAQLLQISLRMSLCKFIENYVDYAKDNREKSSSSLEKFESIIFSGIMSDESKMPSTFDGVDQLTSLIKTFKQ
jgi:hypothetical protein